MSSPNPTLYFDPDTGDLAITSLGIVRMTESLIEEVAQRLDTQLKFFLGEWFLDTTLGVPYYRDVLVRNPDMAVVRSIFQDLVSADPGVEQLSSLEVSLDSTTRVLTVTFSAVLVSNELLTSTVTSSV